MDEVLADDRLGRALTAVDQRSHVHDRDAPDRVAPPGIPSTVGGRSRLRGGQVGGSRLGVVGQADLGTGVAAGWTVGRFRGCPGWAGGGVAGWFGRGVGEERSRRDCDRGDRMCVGCSPSRSLADCTRLRTRGPLPVRVRGEACERPETIARSCRTTRMLSPREGNPSLQRPHRPAQPHRGPRRPRQQPPLVVAPRDPGPVRQHRPRRSGPTPRRTRSASSPACRPRSSRTRGRR